MIAPAPCATHIPIQRIPAGVTIIRAGRPLSAGHGKPFLQRGDEIRVAAPARFSFTNAQSRFTIPHGRVRLVCRNLYLDSGVRPPRATVLAVYLLSGRVQVAGGRLPRRALVLSPEMLVLATIPLTRYVVDRDPAAAGTRAWTLDRPIVAARAATPTLRLNARITYTAISNPSGLMLDVWPFPISALQRPAGAADGLVPYWSDGQACSVGCTAPGTTPGWPLKPFGAQHPLRAGIDEVRPSGPHVAVDIDASNFEPVYAIQSGYAAIRYAGTQDVNVDVGNFYYWHVNPTVSPGQYVVAYQTQIGTILYNNRHLAFSELSGGRYINPLRPGGSLQPYVDSEPPVIGIPRIYADGSVIVGAFDPQSFVDTASSYETPVLSAAALAWRLYNSGGHDLSGLQWALRSSQVYPPSQQSVIFAPGAMNPGYNCFGYQRRCIPNWVYWLAGGLTERLPLANLSRGRYRLAVYAWDFSGNTSALDYWFTVPLAHAASAPMGPLNAQYDP